MQKRIYTLDNLKFMLIALVVMGHIANSYASSDALLRSAFMFIYTFHMPAFIFVSGLFCKKMTAENIRKKMIYYFLLYISLSMILRVNYFIYRRTPSFSLFSENGVPWFMFALAVFYGITYLIRDCNKVLILVFCILLACFIGYDNSIGDFLCLSRIIVFYPFFLLGHMIDIPSLLSITQKKAIRFLSAAIVLAFALICFLKIDSVYVFRPLLGGRNPYSTLSEVLAPYGGFLHFILYFISFSLTICLISIAPPRKIILLSSLGQRTLPVYFFHYLLIYSLRYFSVAQKMAASMPNGVWQLLFLGLGIPITFVFSLKLFELPFTKLRKALFVSFPRQT